MIGRGQAKITKAERRSGRFEQAWLRALVPACSLLLAQLVPITQNACQAQELSKVSSARMKSINQQRSFKKSDAEAGVQLLETIISRVMNIPQVALTKSNTQVAQALKQLNGPTDFRLAIRPKETGKAFAAAPKVPLVIAQAPTSEAYAPPTSMNVSSNANANSDMALDAAEPAGAETWRGGSRITGSASAEKPGMWENSMAPHAMAAPSPLAAPSAGNSGNLSSNFQAKSRSVTAYTLPSTNFSALQSSDSAANGGVSLRGSMQSSAPGGLPPTNMGKYIRQPGDNQYAAKQQIPDLATAVGRFYRTTKGLEEIQNISDGTSSPQIALAEKTQKIKYGREAQGLQAKDLRDFGQLTSSMAPATLAGKLASSAGAGGGAAGGGGGANSFGAESETDSLSSADLERRSATHSAQSVSLRKAKAAKKSEMAPSVDRVSTNSATSDKASRDYGSHASHAASYNSASNENKLAHRERIALLPPNVATGIPGLNLNLGASEMQAREALKPAGGVLRVQRIRNWTVYCWTKKDGDGTDALQLYFRHGLLDAIRIFDPELIAGGFGVSPGDQLELVKERFGEPAFLLPEPGAEGGGYHSDSSGKNYIYPISQVGFQLARRNSESAPQVASVLIFSVK